MWAHFCTQRLVIEPTKFLDILVECVVPSAQCTFYKFFTDYPSPPMGCDIEWVTLALLCKLPHKIGSAIVLRAVTINFIDPKLRQQTEINISDFITFFWLLSWKWEKWQNSDKNCKLVTHTSFVLYTIETSTYFLYHRTETRCLWQIWKRRINRR